MFPAVECETQSTHFHVQGLEKSSLGRYCMCFVNTRLNVFILVIHVSLFLLSSWPLVTHTCSCWLCLLALYEDFTLQDQKNRQRASAFPGLPQPSSLFLTARLTRDFNL